MLPEESLPSKEQQQNLFQRLLDEFLRIEDEEDKLERTAELLGRFGAWFDVEKVLSLIPDTWSLDQFADFFVPALRRLVAERNETVVLKALSSAQNMSRSSEVIEKMESLRPVIVRDEGIDSAYQSMGSK